MIVLYYLDKVAKVTIGTEIFVSVIANVVFWFAAALDIKQFEDQVGMTLISQLFNSISRVFQKLLKYFNATIIWTVFIPSFPVEPIFCCCCCCLNLNETLLQGKLATPPASVRAGSSL